MNQTEFAVIRFENRNGVTSWRVAGWLHGVRIRKNFPTREEAAAEKAVLEIKAAQTANEMRTVATTLTEGQVREAEVVMRRLAALPRPLSFYVDFALTNYKEPEQQKPLKEATATYITAKESEFAQDQLSVPQMDRLGIPMEEKHAGESFPLQPLAPHLLLANKLVRALPAADWQRLPAERRAVLRRDLAPLLPTDAAAIRGRDNPPGERGGLIEDSATAALRLLADLCRQCPELRDWLWEDFARRPVVREGFAQLIRDPATAVNGFAGLAGEDRGWLAERQHLQANGQIAPLFGGLTWPEMERLFRRYEAGTLDLGVFLLAHGWHEARRTGAMPAELMRASIAFLDVVTRGGDRRLLRHYYRALSFLRVYADVPQRRRAVGYAEWWKLRVLLYMLRHPRASYRTRELRAHLVSLGLKVSSLDLRRFCTRHGIRRDMRAGRPRTRA